MQSINQKGRYGYARYRKKTILLHPSSFYDTSLSLIYSIHPLSQKAPTGPSPSQEVAKEGFLCLSPTQATRQALFFVERIARLASYLLRVSGGTWLAWVRVGIRWI